MLQKTRPGTPQCFILSDFDTVWCDEVSAFLLYLDSLHSVCSCRETELNIFNLQGVAGSYLTVHIQDK